MVSKRKQASLREWRHCECGEPLHAVSAPNGQIMIECFECGTCRPHNFGEEDTELIDIAAEAYWERRTGY